MQTKVQTKTDFQDHVEGCGQRALKAAAREAYTQQKKPADTDSLVTKFLPMIHKIVQRVVVYLNPPLSREDLVSAGVIGLLKAAQDYDASYEAEFQTYAYIRIRGAVLDELKANSFVPANVNKQIRKAMKLRIAITEQKGAPPTDDELAEKLEITVGKLQSIFNSTRARHFLSYDSAQDEESLSHLFIADDVPEPSNRIETAELTEKLSEAITELDERLRQIIVLYYQQELTMKEIAEIFNLTESRVSQLHSTALFSLSTKLKQWKYDRE